jgi:hypothetical protein
MNTPGNVNKSSRTNRIPKEMSINVQGQIGDIRTENQQ